MDKEKEFRGARYVRGTLTLSRFFFEFFLFRGGGQKEVYAIYERDFSHSFRKDLSLSVSLSHSSHISLFLFLSYSYDTNKQKKWAFELFHLPHKKTYREGRVCVSILRSRLSASRREKREREKERVKILESVRIGVHGERERERERE